MGRRAEPETFISRVVLPMAEGGEAHALQLLEQARGFLKVRPEALADFRLAVLEACLNALEYGRPPVEVEVEAHRQRGVVDICVRVTDHGPGFCPEAVPHPQIADKLGSPRKRGWGLEIMRRLADSLTVESRSGRTVVTLQRRIPGS